MKIKVDKFKEFLDCVMLSGSLQLKDAVLDFTDKGIELSAAAQNNMICVYGLLKNTKDVITDYKVLGKIGIDDITLLAKYLSKFSEDVNLEIKDNKIVLKESRKSVKLYLRDLEYVESIEYDHSLHKLEAHTISDLDPVELGEFLNLAKLASANKVQINLANSELILTASKFDEVTKIIPVTVAGTFEGFYDPEAIKCLSIFKTKFKLNLLIESLSLEAIGSVAEMEIKLLIKGLVEDL